MESSFDDDKEPSSREGFCACEEDDALPEETSALPVLPAVTFANAPKLPPKPPSAPAAPNPRPQNVLSWFFKPFRVDAMFAFSAVSRRSMCGRSVSVANTRTNVLSASTSSSRRVTRSAIDVGEPSAGDSDATSRASASRAKRCASAAARASLPASEAILASEEPPSEEPNIGNAVTKTSAPPLPGFVLRASRTAFKHASDTTTVGSWSTTKCLATSGSAASLRIAGGYDSGFS